MQALREHLGMIVLTFTEGRRLVITDSAIAQMRKHTQTSSWQSESGGVMLGRHLEESSDLVVDEVTSPQSTDRRSRFSFFRSSAHSQIAEERWRKTLGKIAYLGLWHTHPENWPSPSEVDIRDWAKAIRKDSFDGNYLFFCIVGIEKIRVWAGNRELEFKALEQDK